MVAAAPSATSEIFHAINCLELCTTTSVDNQLHSTFLSPSPAPRACRDTPRPDRHVRFDDRRIPPSNGRYFGAPETPFSTPPWLGTQQSAPLAHAQPVPTGYGSPMKPPGPPRDDWSAPQSRPSGCTNCGRQQLPGNCQAAGKNCRIRSKRIHFAISCSSRLRSE